MDAWVKIFVVLILMSALGLTVGLIVMNPFMGLILLGVLLTLLVVTLEPASGKAMAQVVVPLVIILFVFQIFINPTFIFEPWMLIIVGIMLYLMFAMFTGGSGVFEGGFVDAKVALKLFPIYGIAIIISAFLDPTLRTTVYIMTGTIVCLMAIYWFALRDYDKWPAWNYDQFRQVVALSDINPRGKVKFGAEIWWARTTGPPISSGETVAVLGISGMTMIVARESDVSVQN